MSRSLLPRFVANTSTSGCLGGWCVILVCFDRLALPDFHRSGHHPQTRPCSTPGRRQGCQARSACICCPPYDGVGTFSLLAYPNRLSARAFQAMVLPMANRRRLSVRMNRQCSWCLLLSSAPKMPSIRALSGYSSWSNSLAAFFLLGVARLVVPRRCLMLGDHAHPEDHSVVVLGIVSIVGVKEAAGEVEPAAPYLVQHGHLHVDIVDVARRGHRGQYDLQPQDGRDMVLPSVYVKAARASGSRMP